MDKHEFVSSTGSESTELAKAGDDDGVDDAVDADTDDNVYRVGYNNLSITFRITSV
jgi:hypothetical protein